MFSSKDVIYMLMLYLKLFLILHGIKLFAFYSFTWQFAAFVSARTTLLLAKNNSRSRPRATIPVLMYTVALLSSSGIYFRSEKYETSIFFSKNVLYLFILYIGIWNWFIYVLIALLLVVMLVIYLKQVRSKQF